MNSTTRLRAHAPAARRNTSLLDPAPFVHGRELMGSVRQSILGARQFLLSEQRADGCWTSTVPLSAPQASQLILLSAFLAQEKEQDEQIIDTLAESIRRQQLPCGGWSRNLSAEADLDSSVQAYQALKLVGDDPTQRKMRQARAQILAWGGADCSGTGCRYLLALFGQIDYDHCPVMPPEMLLVHGQHEGQSYSRPTSDWQAAYRAPWSAMWSHRPQCSITMERGVRELFVANPCRWPAPRDSRRNRPHYDRSSWMRSTWYRVVNVIERRGVTPWRRRALDALERRLTGCCDTTKDAEMSLEEAIWQAFGLAALGHSHDADAMAASWGHICESMELDAEDGIARYRMLQSRRRVTSLAAQAVRESGVDGETPQLRAAGDRLCEKVANDYRQQLRQLSTCELASLISWQTTAAWMSASAEALPPAISLCSESAAFANWGLLADDAAATTRPAKQDFAAELARRQRRGGGWADERHDAGYRPPCSSALTGTVLTALGGFPHSEWQRVTQRGCNYLIRKQCANGSWQDADGISDAEVTSSAMRGLLASGTAADASPIAAAVNWLRVVQLPCGAWSRAIPPGVSATIEGEVPHIAHTAAAILALVAAGQCASPTVWRGVSYLVEAQAATGGWRDESSPDAREVSAGCEPTVVSAVLMSLARWIVAFHRENDPEASPQLRLVSV